MTRQNRSGKKSQLKEWMLEHPEVMRLWRDADEKTGRRIIADHVRRAGIYSYKTSASDIPIGGAINELLDGGIVTPKQLMGESE